MRKRDDLWRPFNKHQAIRVIVNPGTAVIPTDNQFKFVGEIKNVRDRSRKIS